MTVQVNKASTASSDPNITNQQSTETSKDQTKPVSVSSNGDQSLNKLGAQKKPTKSGLNVNSKPWTGTKKWVSIQPNSELSKGSSVPVPKSVSVQTSSYKTDKVFGKKKSRSKPTNQANSAPVRPNRFTSKYFEGKPDSKPDSNTVPEASDSDDSDGEPDDFPFIQREVDVLCPFCPQGQQSHFTDPTHIPSHLKTHQLSIRNLYHMTSCLQAYLNYWADRLTPLSADSTSAETESWDSLLVKHTDSQSVVYEINPELLEEDSKIRHQLQQAKLKEILATQEKERTGIALRPRACLFCRVEAENRTALFRHMFSEHGFNIGLPDNLVFVDEFLNKLEAKLNEDRCLYCDKVFKDALVLRKHMRKKKHFKVHPCNHTYDRFYVINYAEPGKNWQALEKEKEDDKPRNTQDVDSASDASWDAWEDDEMDSTKSLFDDTLFDSPQAALDYDKLTYGFDFENICISLELDFYQSVVLVNYIRYQTAIKKCVGCEAFIPSDISSHFQSQACLHSWNLNKEFAFWSDPRYLMPTIENDPLLMYLDPGYDSENELSSPEMESDKSTDQTLSTQTDQLSLQ